MTAYEIDILLWYYTHAADHPDMEHQRPTLLLLMGEKLLESCGETGRCYQITKRGHAYCKALTCVPLPRAAFVIDWPEAEKV